MEHSHNHFCSADKSIEPDDSDNSHYNHIHNHHDHHNHTEIENRKVLLLSFLLTFAFMIVEFFGGLISGSLALISDAGHMLSDSASLIMAYSAIYIGAKKADSLRTFGYKRVETITAFVNAIALVVISFLIIKEGIERLISPVNVNSGQMIFIAVLGLIVNIIIAILLFKNSKSSLNVKGAFLHVTGDLLGSLGAIVAGIIILLTGWNYADPLVSFFVAILILISSFSLLKETFHLLMEGIPAHIQLESVTKTMLEEEEVVSVHDLHIWSLSGSKVILTGHVVIKEINRAEYITEKINKMLHDKFAIEHSTLQVETIKCNMGCCN